MRRRFVIAVLFLIILGSSFAVARPGLAGSPEAQQAFPYQAGFPRSEPRGSVSFASPSAINLNRDGNLEVLLADGASCIWGWDHEGHVLSGFPWKTLDACPGTTRVNGPLAIGDIDNNGALEIVAGTEGISNLAGQRGHIFVWRADGSVLPGWPKEMAWHQSGDGNAEVYSVALANVAGDSQLEILAGTSNNIATDSQNDGIPPVNLYAWYPNGSLLSGYPTAGKIAGIFGQIGAADLTGDGLAEVITGRDHPYLYAYGAQGQLLSGFPARTFVDPDHDIWGIDLYIEYTNNAPAMGDLDGDGTVEIVIAGRVKDPQLGHLAVNSAVLVIEPNGQRRSGWRIAKLGGAPLASSFAPRQAPALADLDRDGKLEIVVTLYDGTIRAYRENGDLMWQYDYAQGQKLYASEPAIGDITGDGEIDIVFGTYSPDGAANSAVGMLGLDAGGQPLPNFPLPLTHEGNSDRKGIRAGPTLADLDRDCDVELLAASEAGVLYVWDLPAPYQAGLMPWPTSRHDNLRTGAVTGAALVTTVSNSDVSPNDSPYTLYLPLIFKGC
jgi:hypothetical protein